MKYQPNQSIVDYNDWDLATSSVITGDFTTDSLKYGFGPTSLSAEDWLPEGNWVDLGYDNAPTEDQLRSQIEAGEHNDAYGDLGCPDCGNVDLFWKTHSSKGQRYRCLSCEYSSNWETVKSQGDLTLQKFGLTVDCPLCSETISAYNRASIDSHFRKHKKEEAEAAEAPEPKVSESEWQEEVEWNDKPKKKTEPEWEDVEWESEQPRKCCECNTTEGLTTIQAGTFCWDCLPINLGAESSQEIKEYITSIHDGDFLWRDGWDNLEFTLQTLPMEIFEEYKDTDNVDGAWEDSPVNSHRLEDTLSQFRWEGDRYPPVVLELDKNGYYDIIDGYHRLNALQILDYDTVEAWVGIPASTFEAEDNSKLFSSIVKDIWNRFSVMESSGSREKYLQRQINRRIHLNSGYGGQNKEANDRYFQAITISDTDLRYYIDEEWDDGPVEFNKLTQESLKRVADLQNDLRTKYNNPSIKLDVHENTTVDIEGSGVFVVEISMDANTSFDAEDSGSPTPTQLLNWLSQPKTITTETTETLYEDWVSEPTRCLWCDSGDIDSETPEHQEEGLIYSYVGCKDCGCIWREEYRYVENEIIEEGEKRILKSEDEQLQIEIEGIDETYGLIPSDPEMLSWAESAVSQYLSRTDLPETFQLHTNPHFVFVSADAFGRSSHVARFRSHTSSHIPIIMLSSDAIRESADDYGVSLKTAVETTVWHELGHVLCELWDMEEIYPFESSNDEEEFAESIAESMYFQEPFQNPGV